VDEPGHAELVCEVGDLGAQRPVAGDHEASRLAEQRRDRGHQQRVVLLGRDPAHRADHPRVVGDGELAAHPLAAGRGGMEPAELDAVGDDDQPALVDLAALAGKLRRLGRHRDERADQPAGQVAGHQPRAALGVVAVLGVDHAGAGEPRRGSAVDQRHPVVGVDELDAVLAQPARDPHHQAEVDAGAWPRHPGDLDPGGVELVRERPVGRRGERDRRHPAPGAHLRGREVERDPLLATDAERRQHVSDARVHGLDRSSGGSSTTGKSPSPPSTRWPRIGSGRSGFSVLRMAPVTPMKKMWARVDGSPPP
jgi:hypothetical protein